jgi:hypothetical protein
MAVVEAPARTMLWEVEALKAEPMPSEFSFRFFLSD